MLTKKLVKYAKKFGEGFPMIPLAWGRTEDETEKLVDKCIDEEKTAYQLGLVKQVEEDEMY